MGDLFGYCPPVNESELNPVQETLKTLNTEELHSLRVELWSLNKSDVSCVKPHLQSIWPLFAVLYGLTAVAGSIGSVYMIVTILAETSCRRFINFLLLNLCLSDLVKSAVVLPLSFYVLVSAHWRLNAVLCYMSPLVQTLPQVVTMLCYVLTAFERYFLVFRPSRGRRQDDADHRLLYALAMVGVWVSGVCLILPLKSCIRYYHLQQYFGGGVDGYGLCAISFDSNTKEINCALFVLLFALPLAFISYMAVRTHQELSGRLRSDDREMEQSLRARPGFALRPPPPVYDAELLPTGGAGGGGGGGGDLLSAAAHRRVKRHRSRSFLSYIDHERTQVTLLISVNRCLCLMVILFATCWSPLQCVMLVCYVIPESEEMAAVVDTLFLIFTWVGLMSTVANPGLLIYQKKSVHAVLHNGISLLRRLSSTDDRRRRSRSEDTCTTERTP